MNSLKVIGERVVFVEERSEALCWGRSAVYIEQ
jgi:hypothetical protein